MFSHEILRQTHYGQMLITFFVAMTPVVELRGAIPVGVAMGLSHLDALLVSIVGNMVPVPFIILFIRAIFRWLSEKSEAIKSLVSRIETHAEGKWEKVNRFKLIGLIILVAIPLPGTGAWTGALVAAVMDLRLKKAIPAILIGVIIAGILVSGITFGFTELLN